jgi:transposase-like protein
MTISADRWPNYCPFCGTHARSGGTGNRHGIFNCRNCHADYSVDFHGAYPSGTYEQGICDEQFVTHGGKLPSDPPPA